MSLLSVTTSHGSRLSPALSPSPRRGDMLSPPLSPSSSSVLDLHPMKFEVVHCEKRRVFCGREWVFKQIYDVSMALRIVSCIVLINVMSQGIVRLNKHIMLVIRCC
jgi:hypothetical protein